MPAHAEIKEGGIYTFKGFGKAAGVGGWKHSSLQVDVVLVPRARLL